MLECNRAQAQINDFLDGTLGASQATALMAHLRDCPECDQEYQELKATQMLLRNAPLSRDEVAQDRIMARFRHTVGAQTQPERARIAWWRNPLPLGLAATAVAAFLLMITITPFDSQVPVTEPISSQAASPLPSVGEMDHMTALHAAQSDDVLGSDELHQNALADANSRLAADEGEAAQSGADL